MTLKTPAAPKATILIVDDDPDFQATTRALLERAGYEVRSAWNGREGLAAIQEKLPDLVVLDVVMEDSAAGYEVTQALRAGAAGHLPILMVSSIEIAPAQRFAWAGEMPMITPDDYLVKPLNGPRFLERVSALLDG